MTYCVFDSACEVVFFASVTRALLLSYHASRNFITGFNMSISSVK